MKIIDKPVPTERTFTIELSESELGTIFLSVAIASHDQVASASKRHSVKYVLTPDRMFELYRELKIALGAR